MDTEHPAEAPLQPMKLGAGVKLSMQLVWQYVRRSLWIVAIIVAIIVAVVWYASKESSDQLTVIAVLSGYSIGGILLFAGIIGSTQGFAL